MNTKISVFLSSVEAIIYLLLYNLHDCTFKSDSKKDVLPLILKIIVTLTGNICGGVSFQNSYLWVDWTVRIA